MISEEPSAGRNALPFSQQRKVSYLMDHSLSDLVSLLWISHLHRPVHFGDTTPAWRYRSIRLSGEKPASFIGVVYLLSQPTPNADEDMIYLKVLIITGRLNGWLKIQFCHTITRDKPEFSLH